MSDSTSTSSPIPVSVLVGFLGSGKTTVLNHLLSENHGRKIAIIVNEFGQINIDSRLIRHTTEKVIQMSNGCICCTLRADLLSELQELSKLPGLEYVLIESTGIGDPLPIAQTFYMDGLEQKFRLDSIITVVDARNFWDLYSSDAEQLDFEGNVVIEPLASLLVNQLEFTNIVLVNKSDLVDSTDLGNLDTFIRRLNPDARIFHTSYGKISPGELIDTRLYNYERGAEADNWDLEWNHPSSEEDEFGFSSFAFKSEALLRWEAFDAFLSSSEYDRVIRSKGIAFFCDHAPVLVSQAGSLCQLDQLEPIQTGDDGWEDQSSELVFIGQHLPQEALMEKLLACVAN